MNYKTKVLTIKMFHVTNNSLATSDGFIDYSISFGIKHANKSQQGHEYNVPNKALYETSVAQTQMRKR